jgi:hypothetical protein
VRNFKSEGQALGQPTEVFATEPCSSAESGVFFYSDGGYLKLSDNFRVGFDLDIKLDFRPRVMSGVLLSVHSQGNGEYLVLQLVNGEVQFHSFLFCFYCIFSLSIFLSILISC